MQRALSSSLYTVGAQCICEWQVLRYIGRVQEALGTRLLCVSRALGPLAAHWRMLSVCARCPLRYLVHARLHTGYTARSPWALPVLAVYCGSTVHVSYIQEVFHAYWPYTVGVSCLLHICSRCSMLTTHKYWINACCIQQVLDACLLYIYGSRSCMLTTYSRCSVLLGSRRLVSVSCRQKGLHARSLYTGSAYVEQQFLELCVLAYRSAQHLLTLHGHSLHVLAVYSRCSAHVYYLRRVCVWCQQVLGTTACGMPEVLCAHRPTEKVLMPSCCIQQALSTRSGMCTGCIEWMPSTCWMCAGGAPPMLAVYKNVPAVYSRRLITCAVHGTLLAAGCT